MSTAPGPEDRYFDSNGVRIRYLIRGQGEPVVLIHGFSVRIETNWEQPGPAGPGLISSLSRDYQVIAFDLRGHGRSDKPHAPEQYGQEMVRDVIRLLDHLDISRAHLAGYSMGAVIAGSALLRYPDRVRSAVLAGGAPLAASRYPQAGWLREPLEQTAESLERGQGIGPLLRFLWPADEPPLTEPQIAETNRTHLAGQDQQALAAALRSWSDLCVADDRLAANRVPILGLAGSLDPMQRALDDLHGRLAHLQVVEIEGAAHIGTPHHPGTVTRPEFLHHLRAFLRAHPT